MLGVGSARGACCARGLASRASLAGWDVCVHGTRASRFGVGVAVGCDEIVWPLSTSPPQLLSYFGTILASFFPEVPWTSCCCYPLQPRFFVFVFLGVARMLGKHQEKNSSVN